MKGKTRQNLRRAGVAVQVAVFSGVMIAFGALALDLGRLYTARGELQRAADSAALAGASAIFTDAGLIRDDARVDHLAASRASETTLQNPTLGSGTILDSPDLLIGALDLNDPNAVLDTSGVNRFNAVQVLLRRAPDSSNGPVSYLFAHIFGQHQGSVAASATAVVDDRFAGYRTTESNRLLTPFTIHVERYAECLADGADDWSFDGEDVVAMSDGVREIRLFPWKLSGGGKKGGDGSTSDGAGNFGILNVGTGHGVPAVEEQILHGITPEQLLAEVGTSELIFYDPFGEPVTYVMGGTPGMKSGMEDALEARIGELVGFFLHDSYSGTGANLTYNIVNIRFGRVMEVNLHGNPSDKRLIIQPVAYTGPGIVIKEYAKSSEGAAGLVRLVR